MNETPFWPAPPDPRSTPAGHPQPGARSPGAPGGAPGTPDGAPQPGAPVGSPQALRPSVGGPPEGIPALHLWGLHKRFEEKVAVVQLSLAIPTGSFFGIVGPNGAGKTTSLNMATGLLRPDAGTAYVHGIDVWADPAAAKPQLGVLPDGVRLFDRLTGPELVTYAGLLRGMPAERAREHAQQLIEVLGLGEEGGSSLVADYSAGMTKKVALACALVHAPRVLVLDEPFESVDPVSAAGIRAILEDFVSRGGTVVLSSHVMDLVQRLCSHVAVLARGEVAAAGTLEEVRAGQDLETRFAQLVGATPTQAGLAWLRPSSD